ncbi:putative ribosomal protein L6 [Rosa chinensis]|uniref:Putative ribosomal protein L6 n=1 Tax=Rosa chinensis TaxID=74649 RepID=A0A2P6S4Y3_ROSCH|nr:putative ribosomal protein L6 [Rosa chinensis]
MPKQFKMKTILASKVMGYPRWRHHQGEGKGHRGRRSLREAHLNFKLVTDDSTGEKKLKIEAWFNTSKTSAPICTSLSHVSNLITDVTKGYRYEIT